MFTSQIPIFGARKKEYPKTVHSFHIEYKKKNHRCLHPKHTQKKTTEKPFFEEKKARHHGHHTNNNQNVKQTK